MHLRNFVHSVNRSKMVRGVNNSNGNNQNRFFFVLTQTERYNNTNTHTDIHTNTMNIQLWYKSKNDNNDENNYKYSYSDNNNNDNQQESNRVLLRKESPPVIHLPHFPLQDYKVKRTKIAIQSGKLRRNSLWEREGTKEARNYRDIFNILLGTCPGIYYTCFELLYI